MAGFSFPCLALVPGLSRWSIGIYCYGSLSDFLDGALARRWACATRIGGAIDLFADKSLTIASLLYIVARGMPIVPCEILLARELLLLSLRSVHMNGRPIIPLTG